MFPALLGALGTIGGGIAGMFAQDDANETNWNIALMNYYQREKERREQIKMANEIRDEQKLGGTDAQGNNTKFVRGKGWVTTLSPQQKLMQALQNREQEQVLTNDLPMKRAQLDKNRERQSAEGHQADALLRQFRRNSMNSESPQALEALLYNAKSRGVNEAADKSIGTAMRSTIRSGSSNGGKLAAAINKQRSAALGDASEDARMASYDLADNMKQKKLSNGGNLYNMFATRASAMPGVSYAPQNIDGSADNLLQMFMQNAQQGSGQAFQAAGKQGGTFDFKMDPNYGLANTLVNGGGALMQAFQTPDSSRLKEDSWT